MRLKRIWKRIFTIMIVLANAGLYIGISSINNVNFLIATWFSILVVQPFFLMAIWEQL